MYASQQAATRDLKSLDIFNVSYYAKEHQSFAYNDKQPYGCEQYRKS